MATADLLTPVASSQRDPAPRLWTDDEFARMQRIDLFTGRTVELIGGIVTDPRTGKPFIFTRKEYYALDDNHFFHNQRVQLIGGVILQESPMNPPHATAISLAQTVLPARFGVGCHIRVQLPIDLGLISEPHPDLAIVTGSPRDYLVDHPKTALLIVEVSDTTLEEDTRDKASLYASGGITDYWVVDLVNDRVLVFRSPKPEAGSKFGLNYASVSAHSRDDKLIPLAAPNSRVLVSDLLL